MPTTNRYMDLRQTISTNDSSGSVFTCGLRCAAEISLSRNRFGRSATSPVDILTEVEILIEGEALSSVQLFPNHVEKTHQIGEAINARSIWFAPWELPVAIVWWRFSNSGAAAEIRVQGKGALNLNYVSKFRKYPNDTAAISQGQIEIGDSAFSELAGFLQTSPAWDECGLFDLKFPQQESSEILEPATIGFHFQKTLTIPASGEIDFVLCYGGSDTKDAASEAVRRGTNDYAELFQNFIETWDAHLNAGTLIETPDEIVNELFVTSKLWAFKDTRIVPFGQPFSTTSRGEQLPILTASPDYHGVFANDNVQSAWEWGALGESIYPVLHNSIEILYRFGTPESVEVDPVNATGKPWLQTMELGPRPQWVMGACSYILWSGERDTEIWDGIQKMLGQFFEDDSDNDHLDDRTWSPFPEQPETGIYHHEMLYVNTFWVQAFRMGAQVAAMFDDSTRVEQYRQTAGLITKAVNDKFASPYGYASWLNPAHEQHPHPGHNMILPLQYQLAEAAHANKTFETIFAPAVWTDDGMLVSGAAFPMSGGAHVWDFMRWNLIHALFLYDRREEALTYLKRWALQEKQLYFQAPEGFPTITGATGKGYSWTAGRIIRSILFGLCGLKLLPEGFTFEPHLPDTWDQVILKNLPFRENTYNVVIKRGQIPGIFLDSELSEDGIISNNEHTVHDVLVVVI